MFGSACGRMAKRQASGQDAPARAGVPGAHVGVLDGFREQLAEAPAGVQRDRQDAGEGADAEGPDEISAKTISGTVRIASQERRASW
jgi:hypothetical protein